MTVVTNATTPTEKQITLVASLIHPILATYPSLALLINNDADGAPAAALKFNRLVRYLAEFVHEHVPTDGRQPSIEDEDIGDFLAGWMEDVFEVSVEDSLLDIVGRDIMILAEHALKNRDVGVSEANPASELLTRLDQKYRTLLSDMPKHQRITFTWDEYLEFEKVEVHGEEVMVVPIDVANLADDGAHDLEHHHHEDMEMETIEDEVPTIDADGWTTVTSKKRSGKKK